MRYHQVLVMPAVIVSRSCGVISRLAVRSWVTCQSLTTATFWSANSGRCTDSGSCSAIRPRSNSCMTAAAATTFDIDASRKMLSVAMPTPSSALPKDLK